MAGTAAILLFAQVVTYRTPIHGPATLFAMSIGLGLAASICVLVWASLHRLPPLLAGLLALGVLMPGMLLHGVRAFNHQSPVLVELGSPFGYRKLLTPVARDSAIIEPSADALELVVPAGSIGYVELRLEDAFSQSAAKKWHLPRGVIPPADQVPFEARVLEEIVWKASLDRENVYFIVFEADRLLVQVTASTVLVTIPDPRGTAHGLHGLQIPRSIESGVWYEWTLRRSAGRRTLLLDGHEIWTGNDTGPLNVVRFGETRTDQEHGGVMRLRGLRATRSLVMY